MAEINSDLSIRGSVVERVTGTMLVTCQPRRGLKSVEKLIFTK